MSVPYMERSLYECSLYNVPYDMSLPYMERSL